MSRRNVQNENARSSDAGGKSSWDDTVSGVPSSEEDDPKTHEPRKGDMSARRGSPGKNPPSSEPARQRRSR